MLENVMYLVSNAFKVYVIARFYEHFFQPKDISKWLRYSVFFGYFLLNSSLYLVFNNSYLNLTSNIVPIFCITYLYLMKLQHRIVFPLVICSLLLFLEGLFYNLSLLIFSEINVSTITLETNLILYCFELLLEHKKIDFPHNIKRLHFLAIVLVITGSILIGTITMRGYSIYIVVVTVTLFMINIIIFSLYDVISKTEQELYEKKILEQQNIAYNNQIKLWEENRKATQTLKHDMKNHLIELKTYLENKDYDKLDEYISQMQCSLDIKDEFVKSGNLSVDSILNYKLKEIHSLTDNVSYSVNIPSDIFVNTFDFNIILGNLLDNSIEALNKCEKSNRFFDFQMEYSQGIMKISVDNTYDGKIYKQNNSFKTTKKDTNLHGIGIESIRNSISKYNGIIHFHYDENNFNVRILLCEDGFNL